MQRHDAPPGLGRGRKPYRTGPCGRRATAAAAATRPNAATARGPPGGRCANVSAQLASSCRRARPARSRVPGRDGPCQRGAGVEPHRLGAVGQLRTELAQRLGVDLAHPALGDAEDLADLRQRQAVVVVHHQHGPLPLGHAVDGPDERLLGLLGLEGVDRAPRPVRQRLAQRRALGAVATAQHLVERHHADRRDLAQRLVEVAHGHLQLGGDLGLVRRAPQRRLPGA